MKQIELPNGTTVDVRLISRADRDRILRLGERSSPETMYRRFLAPPPPVPPADVIDRLVGVDHTSRDAVVAVVNDEIVGVARYDALPVDPRFGEHPAAPRPTTAEFAIMIEDAWQGVGLGRVLLVELMALAADRGFEDFVGVTHADNRAMAGLAHAVVDEVDSQFASGLLELRFALPARVASPSLAR